MISQFIQARLAPWLHLVREERIKQMIGDALRLMDGDHDATINYQDFLVRQTNRELVKIRSEPRKSKDSETAEDKRVPTAQGKRILAWLEELKLQEGEQQESHHARIKAALEKCTYEDLADRICMLPIYLTEKSKPKAQAWSVNFLNTKSITQLLNAELARLEAPNIAPPAVEELLKAYKAPRMAPARKIAVGSRAIGL